jgi:hypothetical protein
VEDLRLTASSTQIFSLPAAAVPPTAPAPNPAETDLWIFRDGRKTVSGPAMLRDLQRRVSSASTALDALIQAGELEAALSDAQYPDAHAASALTDALAYMVCTGVVEMGTSLQQLAARIKVPESISVSPPEGFTYYALHPSDFANAVGLIPAEPRAWAIVGIRSIGTTLSAMTVAALRASGRRASRITVRPTGHPYSRNTEFSTEETQWIHGRISQASQFLIVDEGPGRSGSTFLSVAEALLRTGVPRETITIIGSRQFDPASLCAENAPDRWRNFRFIPTVPSVSTQFENCLYLGGGEWRKNFCDTEEHWPESWTQMERLKFLSSDRKTLFKFEGMGPIGAGIRSRAFALADAGFSPPVSDAGDGFLAYATLEGRPLRKEDLSASLLERFAQYCAFRVSEFRCERSASSTPNDLREMLEFNVQQEFGRQLKLGPPDDLACTDPVLVDGRMQPYEWIGAGSGEFIKTDAISHGDNHFFPGPCDIAWDLAGAAVEWQLGADELEFLSGKFARASGTQISRKIAPYMLAYCIFRLGFCKMAMSTVRGSSEERRLEHAYGYYRRRAEQSLFQVAAAQSGLALTRISLGSV